MCLRRLFIIGLGAFSLGFAVSPALGYSVNKCDSIAENDISVAADYIDRRAQLKLPNGGAQDGAIATAQDTRIIQAVRFEHVSPTRPGEPIR
jgi:hypothetical protein